MTLPSKKDIALIGLMLGIALCLRIFFLYFLSGDPTSSALILDARPGGRPVPGVDSLGVVPEQVAVEAD